MNVTSVLLLWQDNLDHIKTDWHRKNILLKLLTPCNLCFGVTQSISQLLHFLHFSSRSTGFTLYVPLFVCESLQSVGWKTVMTEGNNLIPYQPFQFSLRGTEIFPEIFCDKVSKYLLFGHHEASPRPITLRQKQWGEVQEERRGKRPPDLFDWCDSTVGMDLPKLWWRLPWGYPSDMTNVTSAVMNTSQSCQGYPTSHRQTDRGSIVRLLKHTHTHIVRK